MPRRSLLLAALAAVALASSASAQDWTGTGESGSDPFAHPWLYRFVANTYAWGMPGLGETIIPWEGTRTLTGFRITFLGAALIGGDVDPDDFIATRMRNATADRPWTTTVSLDRHTAFFASTPGAELAPGDDFFVNVVLEPTVEPVAFVAHYDAADTIVNPEPATLALVAGGLAVAAIVARRRRR